LDCNGQLTGRQETNSAEISVAGDCRMSLAAPLRLPHNSLIIAQGIASSGSVVSSANSVSEPVTTTAAPARSSVAAMPPAEAGNSVEASSTARSLPLAATQLSRSGLNPQASAYPCSVVRSLDTSSAPVTPPSTPAPSVAESTGGEDSPDDSHTPSRVAEYHDDCPEPEAEDGSILGNRGLDLDKLGLANLSNDGTTAEVCDMQQSDMLPAISQQVALQTEQQQPKTLHIGLPDTPPQQAYLPGPCSPPSLTVDVSSVSSSSVSIGGGDKDSSSPMESPVGRMPYALSAALTDAVVRNNTAELAAALSTGLSPDTSVAWYPPDSLTGAPIERSLVALAAYYGSRDAVAHLLALGADPNLPSAQDGMTSLHAAAAGGSIQTVEIIHLLLAHGADRNALDSFGRIPVEVLVQQQKQGNSSAAAAAAQQQQQQLQVPTALGQQWDDSFGDDGILVGPHVPDPTGCSELSDINRPEYTTDEFRINCFKVLKCTKSRAHDWTECPFVHPGEKARRRSPQKFSYSSTACPDFRKGVCRRGDLCGFSHGVFECWLHPARYRTQMCKDGPLCTRRVCFFAHTVSELRAPVGPAHAGGCCTPASDTCSNSNDLCGAICAYTMPPPGLQPSSAALASPPSLQLQQLQLQQQEGGQQMLLSGPFVPGMSALDYHQQQQRQQQRRHSDVGEHSYSKSYSWPQQRRSMQGNDESQQQQVSLSLAEAPPSLSPQPQEQQQQQQFLLQQQQQQTSMSGSSPYGSLSCPTSPLVSPLQSPPASSPPTTARPPLNRTLWSPPVPLSYSIAPRDNTQQQQQSCAQGSSGGPAPRWLQQVREAELLDSPNISRVGSLSALDVSWVDELTHAE